MNKPQADYAIVAPANTVFAILHKAFRSWRENRRLRKTQRELENLITELDGHTLYDIGLTDLRPPYSARVSGINNVYRLLSDEALRRNP